MINNEFLIKDFSLYKGVFSGIPDSLDNNPFFWERLSLYLERTAADTQSASVNLTIVDQNNEDIIRYRVKNNSVFLTSDNWDEGLDSRYFGPVPISSITGRIIFVLWSLDPDAESFFNKIRPRRILKFIGSRQL